MPAAAQANVTVLQVDITSDESISAATKTIQETHGRLDVLIQNAGVCLDPLLPGQASEWESKSALAKTQETFSVNVFGTVRIIEAFEPLMRKSILDRPRIICISSALGSITIKSSGAEISGTTHEHPSKMRAISYGPSKAAVVSCCYMIVQGGFSLTKVLQNMVVCQFAMKYKFQTAEDPTLKQIFVNAVCPGAVQTPATNYFEGFEPVENGAVEVMRILKENPDLTASFTNKEGQLAW